MAMGKLPRSAISSVEALAEDVQRYLQRRPVLAHPYRPWYRASMFLRRHWLAFLSGTLLLLILMAASAITAWQARVARARAKQAEEAKAMIISMLLRCALLIGERASRFPHWICCGTLNKD